MNAGLTTRTARLCSGLTLRALSRVAGTSHSTLAAYESGRVTPSAETFERLVRATGYEPVVELRPTALGPDRAARGRELVDALELAAMFPARHAATIGTTRFGEQPRGQARQR